MKYLLIGSTRANSGKSATILGMGLKLQELGLKIGYSKPLGTFTSLNLPDVTNAVDADVEFITHTLKLAREYCRPTLVSLDRETLKNRLSGSDRTDYFSQLKQCNQSKPEIGNQGDLILVEAPANTAEGALFGLNLEAISEALDAPFLLVIRYGSLLVAEHMMISKARFGDRLLGVVINDIPASEHDTAKNVLAPFLESLNIPVLAMMPENRILRSVSVQQLVEHLGATILYQSEQTDLADLMVEELKIGAMNVNSAQIFFRKSFNKAVVTASDRVDIQLAALETSTNCLVLTGAPIVSPETLQRASELEVPILSVNTDTLTTVEIIENSLGRVRLQGGIKVQCIQEMMHEHFNFNRLLKLLEIKLPT
jgi:uncharacterized protein